MLKVLKVMLVACLLCGCTMANCTNIISQSKPSTEYNYDAEGRIPERDLADVDLSHTDTLFGVIYTEYPEFKIIPYNEEDLPKEFKQNGKYGYKDKSGNVIVEPIYDCVFSYKNGFGEAWNGAGDNLTRYYFKIDGTPLDFDELTPIKDGIALVRRGEKYGFINTNGEIIIPIIYDDVFHIDSELYVYAVKNGVGVCLDLKYGYEKAYEKFDMSRKNFYNKVIDVKDYDIVIVNWFILINGEEDVEKTSPLPLCILSSLEFDTYVNGKGVVKQKGNLKHEGYYEPNMAVRFEQPCDFAVPCYQKIDFKNIAQSKNTVKYQLTVNQYLLDSGIGKQGIIEQCFEGDIYGDGTKGAVIKIRDAYGNRWENDEQSKEEPQFFDSILAITDVNRPTEYNVLSEEKGVYNDEGELFTITTRDILNVADVNHDGKVEVITEDGYYEWMSASMIRLPEKQPDAPSEWAVEEVRESEEIGLVPENLRARYEIKATRLEFCKLVMTLLDKKNAVSSVQNISENPYTDTDDRDILIASQLGIVNGKGNKKFDPYGYITREEAAAMLYRTAKVLNYNTVLEQQSSVFQDDSKISKWAKDAVRYVSTAKDQTNGMAVMGGTGENIFTPDGPYTRQQAFITMKRLYNVQ